MSGRKSCSRTCPSQDSRLPQPIPSRLPVAPRLPVAQSRLPQPSTSLSRPCPARTSSRPSSAASGGPSGRGNVTSVSTRTFTDTKSGKSITTVIQTFEKSDKSSRPGPSANRSSVPRRLPAPCPGRALPIAPPRRPQRQAPCSTYVPPPRPQPVPKSCKKPKVEEVPATTSLERAVEAEAEEQAAHSPDGSAKARGSQEGTAEAPIVETDDGPVRGSQQITLEKTVDRTPEGDKIKTHMTVLQGSTCGCAHKDEYSVQQIQPRGMSTSQDPSLPLHDVISVTKTVTIGPDFREQIDTAAYEIPEDAEEEPVDPAQVSQMIDEEIEDVDKLSNLQPPELKGSFTSTFGLKKKLQKMKLNPDSVRRLESSVVYPPISADEAQEEMQPELMAAIMHTEEQGLNMDSFPSNVCNYLFPDDKDEVVIKINPVVPGVLQNIVVPGTVVPAEVRFHALTPELETTAVEATGCGQKRPTENLFSQSISRTGAIPKAHNTTIASQNFPDITVETPPWGENLQPIMTYVGAPPYRVETDADLDVPSAFYHELENVLEYHLMPEPPQHVSKVQLRGSQKPAWFPGYYMALPDNIKVVTSPCEVLPAAWQAVQPDIFSDDSFLIVG